VEAVQINIEYELEVIDRKRTSSDNYLAGIPDNYFSGEVWGEAGGVTRAVLRGLGPPAPVSLGNAQA
jgi:hypothetical protein